VNLDWRKTLRGSTIDSTAKLIGFVLDTYARPDGYCFPGRETIARGASCNVRTVDQAVRRLEARGFLRVQRSRGRSVNHYFLRYPDSEARSPLSGSTANDDRRNGESDDTATANVAAFNGGARSPEAGSNQSVNPPTNAVGEESIDEEPAKIRELPPEVREFMERLRRGTLVQRMP
jgi:hypothetical protein